VTIKCLKYSIEVQRSVKLMANSWVLLFLSVCHQLQRVPPSNRRQSPHQLKTIIYELLGGLGILLWNRTETKAETETETGTWEVGKLVWWWPFQDTDIQRVEREGAGPKERDGQRQQTRHRHSVQCTNACSMT